MIGSGAVPSRASSSFVQCTFHVPRITDHVYKRSDLGIPNPDPKLRRWTEAEDALLGTEGEEKVASRLGRTISAIIHRAARLSIPSRFHPPDRPWSNKEVKLLGKYADEEIAARSGRTVKAVEAKRESLEIPNAFATFHEWTEEEIRLLR